MFEPEENPMRPIATSLIAIAALFALTACEPEVGSEKWCAQIKEKGVDNVTANEAADFAKNCVL
jgi:hypothetical protein